MNVDSSTERGFEIIVVHLPRNDLGVSAFQVSFEHNVPWVGHEKLPYVGQNDAS